MMFHGVRLLRVIKAYKQGVIAMTKRFMKVKSEAREKGFALLVAIMAVTVMAFVGASFALMVVNESHSINANVMATQALYVAESGIQDVLFQRSKKPADMCFPYFFFDESMNETQVLDTIEDMTGSKSGGITEAPSGTCDPTVSSIDPINTTEDLPCWPYNEELYANYIHWGPNFDCNDGSDPDICPYYNPLLWWPDNGGQFGWKDWDDAVNISRSYEALTSASESSGARYTTGFFTLCTDDFAGITAGDPGYDEACQAAKGGGTCNQYVIRLSIVSVGEVQSGDKVVRRAVKVDLAPPALYTGVIDKYIDTVMLYQYNINGPIHINGWKYDNSWHALLYDLFGVPLGFGNLLAWLDPPEVISVSYPEIDPDPQPDLFGLPGIDHNITWIHLPVRIEIPQVNWDKWENRMDDLYGYFDSKYSDATVYDLKYCKFGPAGSVTTTQYDCGDAGEHFSLDSGENDQDMDNSIPKFNCPPNAGSGRIHNCNRNANQVWDDSTKYIFDLHDMWNETDGIYVQGDEPNHIPGTSDPGPRDKSLEKKVKLILDPHFDIGCLTCVISNGMDLGSFESCCLGSRENRYAFTFMGKHEFRDYVFIDGVMGMGTRTPYHSCGPGDGGLSLYCIQVPEICMPWPLDSVCLPSFQFGLPHWHLGNAVVSGEVLVNGRLYFADWIQIEGGTVYADEHIIKDESSGYDITLELDTLLCWIITGGSMSFEVIGISIDCSWIMAPINVIMQTFFPWWPDINLTNNGILDFETYLDINGSVANSSPNVVNPGTLYTRGDFRLLEPGWDAISFLGNTLIGKFLPFLNLVPAIDPIRIYNGGAIVAGGKETGGAIQYIHGNIYLTKNARADILTYNPDTGQTDIGYVLARGGLRVWSDIIADYGLWGLANSCSVFSNPTDALDADCAAQGIFYSGGISAGSNPLNSFNRTSLSYSQSGYDYNAEISCLNDVEAAFWPDVINQVQCWLNAATDEFFSPSEINISGHLFAGAVAAMPGSRVRIDQQGSVRHDAVTRQYFRQLGGVPIDWIEVDPPSNMPSLPF